MAWVFEDKFNSDTKSTGDLNGQDSWTGTTSTDVVTTQMYEGDQAVYCVAETSIRNTFTALSEGVVYFALRPDNTSGGFNMDFLTGVTGLKIRLSFVSGPNVTIINGGSTTTVITGFSANVWYLFELTINADDTHDIRYHDGSDWSTPITGLANNTGITGDIDTVRLNSGTPGSMYVDYISPTNPIGGGASVFVPRVSFIM